MQYPSCTAEIVEILQIIISNNIELVLTIIKGATNSTKPVNLFAIVCGSTIFLL